MLPTFGFTVEQLKQIHEALANARTALENCQHTCRERNQKFLREFEAWFGEAPIEENEPSVKMLIHTVEQMKERLHHATDHLHLKFCDDPGQMGPDQANVDSFNPRHSRFNVKSEIDSYYGSGNNAEIRIALSFFEQIDAS